jgi:hypothetical protein
LQNKLNICKFENTFKIKLMKKILALFLLISALFAFVSCDLLENQDITEEEVVSGLKTALEMGTDTACTDLHQKDGYFGNELVKILLPPEADQMFDMLNDPTMQALGLDVLLQQKIDTVILAINRSAEDAAAEAKPIFVDAITNMTITDGMNILQGDPEFLNTKDSTTFDSLAATHYMEFKTRESLFSLYEPKISASLDKDLGLGISANDAWNTLIYFYNNYLPVFVNGITPVDEVDLGEYATEKGLDGLFLFVGKQEKQIRDDPYKWGSDIIEKVFGYVYQE